MSWLLLNLLMLNFSMILKLILKTRIIIIDNCNKGDYLRYIVLVLTYQKLDFDIF